MVKVIVVSNRSHVKKSLTSTNLAILTAIFGFKKSNLW